MAIKKNGQLCHDVLSSKEIKYKNIARNKSPPYRSLTTAATKHRVVTMTGAVRRRVRTVRVDQRFGTLGFFLGFGMGPKNVFWW